MKTLYLTNDLRKKLKKPLGIALPGNKKEILRKFRETALQLNLEKIITVGDYCSFNLPSDVKIFDGRIKRNQQFPKQKHSFSCLNPPASINKGAWDALKQAFRENKNIFVEGEEDLLVIPSILLSKNKWGIVYGLPNEGACLVEVSDKIKKILKSALKEFRKTKFNKIVLGGTFDIFHAGHRYFLSMAKYYAKEAIIGLTSDEMAEKKKGIKPRHYEKRKKTLEAFLKKIRLKSAILKIDDIYGPAVFDKNLDAILLTEDTLENGLKINKERKRKGLKELDYIVLHYILDEKGKKISSRYLKRKNNATILPRVNLINTQGD